MYIPTSQSAVTGHITEEKLTCYQYKAPLGQKNNFLAKQHWAKAYGTLQTTATHKLLQILFLICKLFIINKLQNKICFLCTFMNTVVEFIL
jgi:hypothetical protein